MIAGHPTEEEVFALPGAQYKVKSHYWTVTKEGGLMGFKKGAKFTEQEWKSKFSTGAPPPSYDMYNDGRLVRVVEVEEI